MMIINRYARHVLVRELAASLHRLSARCSSLDNLSVSVKSSVIISIMTLLIKKNTFGPGMRSREGRWQGRFTRPTVVWGRGGGASAIPADRGKWLRNKTEKGGSVPPAAIE